MLGDILARMRVFRRVARLLTSQRLLIEQQNRVIAELQRCVVVHQQSMLSMAISFRAAAESDVDIREELDSLISDLSDSLSVIEEYVL